MSSDSSEGSTADELPDALMKLLARIETRAALPGLNGSARAVQRLARDDGARLQSLAAAVVGDPGLSHRLLRSSNAAHFLPTGAGSIASIQRAIAVLGFDAVQLLSKALRALEADPGGVTDRLVRHELMRSTLAGTLAVCLTTDGRRLEETQLTAMFQNLGRMLVAVHLPDEALAVRARVPKAHWPRAALEQSASRELLGMEFGHIGVRLISVQEVTVHARPQSEHWRGVRSAPSRKCLSGNEFLLVLQSAVERLFVGSISAGGACFRRGL